MKPNKIGKIPFPFKAGLSEGNVKTNRMATTKWTYHKEWRKFVPVLEPHEKSYFDVPTTQMSIFVFFVSAGN